MPDHRPVVVVADSTADIPASFVADLGIGVVPLSIQFGSETFRDGIDLTPEAFLERLRTTPELPTTSQPPVTAFEEAFRNALDRGQDVVCVTISSKLSGTFNSARLAAETVDATRITVVDTSSATMAVGWVAIAAARAARDGQDLASVAAVAEHAVHRVSLLAVLRTLDYAHKGGRIGRARALAGSVLAIKPILTLVDGVLVPVERIRTWNKAVARMEEMVEPGPTDIMVLHSDNLDDANRVAGELRTKHPGATVGVHIVGATITTYAGPGAIGIASMYPLDNA